MPPEDVTDDDVGNAGNQPPRPQDVEPPVDVDADNPNQGSNLGTTQEPTNNPTRTDTSDMPVLSEPIVSPSAATNASYAAVAAGTFNVIAPQDATQGSVMHDLSALQAENDRLRSMLQMSSISHSRSSEDEHPSGLYDHAQGLRALGGDPNVPHDESQYDTSLMDTSTWEPALSHDDQDFPGTNEALALSAEETAQRREWNLVASKKKKKRTPRRSYSLGTPASNAVPTGNIPSGTTSRRTQFAGLGNQPSPTNRDTSQDEPPAQSIPSTQLLYDPNEDHFDPRNITYSEVADRVALKLHAWRYKAVSKAVSFVTDVKADLDSRPVPGQTDSDEGSHLVPDQTLIRHDHQSPGSSPVPRQTDRRR